MQVNQTYDYGADAAASSGGATLEQLSDLAKQQLLAERAVQDAEEKLKLANEALADIAEKRIPEVMDGLGLTKFETASGITISVKESVRAAISKERMPQACAWLRANDSGSLIKRAVSVSFGRGEDGRAQELLERLGGEGFEAEDKLSVHPSTLSAYVREKLEAGVDLPMDLLGVHRDRRSQVKLPK